MRSLRVTATLAAALLATLAPDAPAHEGNPNYRSEVTSVTPATDGLTIEVVNFDDSFSLINRSGKDVVVEGYEGEPYLRILADGTVAVNRNSTAYFLNDDRFAEAEVPDDLDPEAEPDWETIDRSSRYSWHDHRMHWMSTTVPPQAEDESKRTKIFDYEIPITVGGRGGAIAGTLTWVGTDDSGFPVLPALAVVAGLGLAVTIGFVRRRRSDLPRGDSGEAW